MTYQTKYDQILDEKVVESPENISPQQPTPKNQTFPNEKEVKPAHSFLHRAMVLTELPQIPQDLPTMQTWSFTRCRTYDHAYNLLRIYQTLLVDLDFTPREIEDWLAQGHLGRNIVMHFEGNLGKIPEHRMTWLMAHLWIWGLDPDTALGADVPIFKFSDEGRKYLGQFEAPVEWAGMLTLEIESAMEWELEIARSLARVQAAAEPKGFLETLILGKEKEEPLKYERCFARQLERVVLKLEMAAEDCRDVVSVPSDGVDEEMRW
ncbi:hypothetical protein BDP81DRAFT_476884 [Colletotrichum phormii]|uniref:Uncharacterized protein n=1 Tax=Colletotrichum phormii TaxID=359342 RepID=A0AAJ0E7K4_9PEZI|nr:uncharacterized protein BDP81DRAFT_476884 [Colletotrichum phormii]KAK1621691.1 hypothetical protein BDP81DRAFT_476884 [Colletotrichum phormii]